MDILLSDTVSVATAAKLLLRTTANLQISSAVLPVDAVAPPPVRSTACTIPRRTLLRRRRRIKRKLSGGDGSGDEGLFFGDGGDGGGGFGGSGGGGGWNFNNYGGGDDWDESSSSVPDPAFDFVYQVLSWIMLSNCLHFAFKKILRIVLDADREKVPRRLAPIC